MAELVGGAAGVPVRGVTPALEDVLAGADPWTTEVIGSMFRRVGSGVFGEVTGTIAQVTGRAPRTLEQFVAEHWRPIA